MISRAAGSIQSLVQATLSDIEDPRGSNTSNIINQAIQAALTDGTGAEQFQDQFAAAGQLVAAGTVSFNLLDASLSNPFGTIVWTKLKALVVLDLTTDGDSMLQISGNLIDQICGAAGAIVEVRSVGATPQHGWFEIVRPDLTAYTVGASNDTITLTHKNDGTLAIDYFLMALGVK